MIEQLFEVATEFRFDVGQAVVNTKSLTNAVDDLSAASDSAMGKLGYLAGGLVAHLGFGSGGLLTIMSQAVQMSEAFNFQALSLSQNIFSNFKTLTGTIGTFNDRLETSKMLMGDIQDTAIKVGIPTAELARMTNMFATPLANRGKLGTNYEGAIRMSKNVMLGAEMSGINPNVAAESVYRAMTDHMALHGALFARLVNTTAFKSAHVVTQQQFMGMNGDKKIDLLDKALASLAGDADALAYRLGTLKVQLIILKEQVMVILKPIGDALGGAFRKILQGITGFLQQNGKALGESIGKIIDGVFDDPKALLINLMTLKSFGADFKKAMHLVELVGTFRFIRWVLMDLLGITFNGGLLRAMFGGLVDGVMWLVRLVPWGRILAGVFNLIWGALIEVLPLFLGFLVILQTISKAQAKAQVRDAQEWIELTPRFLNVFGKLKTSFANIMLPITNMIDVWSDWLSYLFTTSIWGRILVNVLEDLTEFFALLGNIVLMVMGIINGVVTAMLGAVADLQDGINPLKHMSDHYNTGFWEYYKRAENPFKTGDATSHTVTNIGKIEIRNDFREQLEPDRIAFSLKEQLLKIAQNPTQARGQSFSGSFSGGAAFAGAR